MKKKKCVELVMAATVVCSVLTSKGNDDLNRSSGDEIIKHPVIHLLDGVPFAFDGDTIYDMIIVNAKIFRLQHGAKNKETGQLEGIYTFEGQKHSLHSLAELELSYDSQLAQAKEQLENKYVNFATFEPEWNTKEKEIVKKFDADLEEAVHPKDRHVSHETARRLERVNRRELQEALEKEKDILKRKHMSNAQAFDKEFAPHKQEYENKIATIQPIFMHIRDDFINLMRPFISLAKGSKHFMLELIYDWSKLKQGKKDSLLLRWDETKEGEEETSYLRDMTRLQYLDSFCADQRSLVKTIVHSCPKGYKQFQELRAKQQEANAKK